MLVGMSGIIVCFVHTRVHACGGYEWHAESKQLISIIKLGQVPEALSVCLHQLSTVDSVWTTISGC